MVKSQKMVFDYEFNRKSRDLKSLTTTTLLRAPRVAIFVNKNDKDWVDVAFHLFNLLPTIWGGNTYIVIPTDYKTISSIYKKILKMYDPDYIYRYSKTGYDLIEKDKKLFYSYVEKHLLSLYKGNKLDAEKDIHNFKETVVKNILELEFDSVPKISKEILNFIKKDLSVFHYGSSDRIDRINYSGFIPHNLPNLTEIISSYVETRALKIVDLDLSNHSIDFQLMGYSMAGRNLQLIKNINSKILELNKDLVSFEKYRPDDVDELKKKIDSLENVLKVKLEKFKRDEKSILYKSIWNKSVDLNGYDFRYFFKKKNSKKDKKYDFFTRVPFARSNLGLSFFYEKSDFAKKNESRPILVVGDSCEDFFLYYSLTRTRSNVYWLSYKRLILDCKKPNCSSYTHYLVSEINEDIRNNGFEKIYFTSTSLSQRTIKKIPKKLDKNQFIVSADTKKISEIIDFTNDPNNITPYILRSFERRNYRNSFACQFINNQGISFINTPKPKFYNATDPLKHKWISEIQINNYSYPSTDLLIEDIVNKDSISVFSRGSHSIRVSHTGIHYTCPASGLISANDEVDDHLPYPKVNILSAQQIFEKLFFSFGYHIKRSDKGNYFYQSMKKVGGFDVLVDLLKNKETREFLKFYIKFKKPQSGVFNEGCVIDDKRIYFDLDSLINLFNKNGITINKDKIADLIDDLIEKNVLHRGYILKCNHCKNCDWYPISGISEKFICHRCGSKHLIKQIHFRPEHCDKLPYEPVIFYKLDEIIYQFLDNNGDITALTLNKLKEKSDKSFLFLTETEFRKNENDSKANFEIDIISLIDGEIYLGEAKIDANASNEKNRLKVSQIENLISFDNQISLKGLVFTSLSSKWSSEVKNKFSEIKEEKNYDLILFEEKDFI